MRAPRVLKGIAPILIMFIAFLSPGIASAGVPTEVVVSKSVLVNLNKPAERVSIANPAIADLILISPAQLQINGLATGSTSLIVWEKGNNKPSFFDVNVIGDLSQLEPQIKDLAPKDNINVEYAKDTVILSGTAANDQTVAKVVQVAKAYAPNVLNHIRVDEPQQVILQVKVAQVDKTALRRLGISALVKGNTGEGFYNTVAAPNGSVSGTKGSSTTTTTTSSTLSSAVSTALGDISPLGAFQAGLSYFPSGIGTVLQALSSKGLAKILAEPNLMVKSGQEGYFLAGSKIPIQIIESLAGTSTSTIRYENVGISLKFSPVVMENGMIALKINPAEVSSIQGFLTSNGYPIIDSRTVNTSVELKDGESLVLAGLLSEENIKTMSKIPLMGDIPILGALFRSTVNDLKEKELVFFITPKLVKPMAPGAKAELPTDKDYKEQEKELQWVPLGK